MNDRGAPPKVLAGFLVVTKTVKEDGFIGAWMVTDEHGYPLEFRATTPIRPSLVQRTLYGAQLEHFVGVELCSKTLLRQSSRKPRVVLVPERSLLDVVDYADSDVVAIWRAGEALKVEEGEAASTRGTVKSAAYQPIVFEGRFREPQRAGDITALLEDCLKQFDLVEAFERMRMALQQLAKEDPRYA